MYVPSEYLMSSLTELLLVPSCMRICSVTALLSKHYFYCKVFLFSICRFFDSHRGKDLKLGQYTKVPPRMTFAAQMVVALRDRKRKIANAKIIRAAPSSGQSSTIPVSRIIFTIIDRYTKQHFQ